MNEYKIHGYITVPFEVVVHADDQDEAEEVVHGMDFDDLMGETDPDGECTIEKVWLNPPKGATP